MKEKVKKESSHEIRFTVDGENYSTNERELTPNQILSIAGIDVSNHYLVEIKGSNQISYKGKPNEIIKMHNNMKFISVFNGATPVA